MTASTPLFNLTGRTALITGSCQGIGLGIAEVLAQMGARIILNGLITDEEARPALNKIRKIGAEVIYHQADVTDESSVENMFSKNESKFGSIDIMINNAGICYPHTIEEISLQEWQEMLNVNITANFLCARAAFKRMKARKWGRIIQISSVTAHQGALFGHVHYAASKGAQLSFSKTLARTAAPYNITVNSICPGIILTDLLQRTYPAEKIKELADSVPLGLGNPYDVGAAAGYLCSESGRYVTGATIDINGGMNIR
ncbi:SDR family NAD(P)-dependent oxidoreductase [Coraliomargarita algicola]|uniref:SDR family NAD(P)-dependent oxidoreductase n=1 Tax=Coraliomargarita algicola TaxID=3092156 RepID=A0ABZ0RKB7_9BACT|nr:SDR family NAD(P)-dependent oxidoreductase [Coraliomargarita sp. J2-16]WPJ95362.1 SDR family NAD(P)-dependent oxidoreductase [Coraliomargarita sp. J2-16]